MLLKGREAIPCDIIEISETTVIDFRHNKTIFKASGDPSGVITE